MRVTSILFDIGEVLVRLRGAIEIQRLSNNTISINEIKKSWLKIESVVAFETGQCDELDFASGVIDFFKLPTKPKEFNEAIASAVDGAYPGTRKFLQKVGRKYRISCITNTNPIQWPIIKTILNAENVFEHCIVSYEIGHMKPGEEIYKIALDRTGYHAESTLFVDDNQANIDMGEKCGLISKQTIGLEQVKQVINHLESKAQ